MFPNIRLMIAAVLASILGIACGLGLFAAFGVNREPFARPSDEGPPLQLVFAHAMPAADATAAPFGVRFRIDEPPAGGAETAKAAAAANAPAAAPPQQTAPAQEAAPASAAPSDAKPTAAATAEGKVKTARKPARRYRAARRARLPQAGAPPTDQNFTAAPPTFQWAPAAQATQRVRRETAAIAATNP